MKKKKLLVAVIVLLALVLGCTAFVVFGVILKEPKFKYTVNDDNKTCTIIGMEESRIKIKRKVTIPSEIDGYTITSIGDEAFSGLRTLEEVTIPDSVTSIGTNAFSSCTFLTSVTIPNSVTSIGQRAFADCSSLTSIVLPDGVKFIDYYTFSGCSSLETVIIPDGVTSISGDVFTDCSSLKYNEYGNGYYLGNQSNPYAVLVKAKDTTIKNIQINSSTRIIYSSAFADCKDLDDVIIPDGVTDIGVSTFVGCTSLTSIKIPYGITDLNSTFEDCSRLTSVSIPKSVKEMRYTFKGCPRLTDIYYAGTEEEWRAISIMFLTDSNVWPFTVHYDYPV